MSQFTWEPGRRNDYDQSGKVSNIQVMLSCCLTLYLNFKASVTRPLLSISTFHSHSTLQRCRLCILAVPASIR